MKRTTIMLPHKLKLQAEGKAHRNGESLGEWIRQSLQQRLNGDENTRKRSRFFADNFTFKDNGPPDLAENAGHYATELLVCWFRCCRPIR